ncbi:MAG: alkaline phosphatase family protein [Anaerolineae bacterium]
MTDKPRIVIVSLDGTTWDLLGPLCREGVMPNLAALLEEGVSGILESSIPPVTAPAWISFQTGKNPGKHGFFHFTAPCPGTYETYVMNASKLQERTLWHIVGEQGRRICAINVPMTYPPRPVNGCMISGLLTPSLSKGFYPPELRQELLSAIGDYTIFIPIRQADFMRPREFIAKMTGMVHQRLAAARYLMDREDWDLSMVHVQATDIVQHACWALLDPRHPLYPSGGTEDKLAAQSFYRELDRLLGDLWDKVRGRATIVVMSDHGFAPAVKRFYLNQWLAEQKLLFTRRNLKQVTHILETVVRKVDVLKLRRRLLRPRSAASQVSQKARGEALTNWSRTRAYAVEAPFFGRIYLNVAGRQAQGCVQPGSEYEDLRDQIAARLMQVSDPETGEALIERVYKREEIYHGRRLDDMPDLIVQPRSDVMIVTEFRGDRLVEATPSFLSGTHHPHGILVMAGPAVRPSGTVEGASLVDMAPTLLHLLGLPVPDDMDGTVLLDALDPAFVAAHPVQYVSAGTHLTPDAGDDETDEEAETVEERLEALGYLG